MDSEGAYDSRPDRRSRSRLCLDIGSSQCVGESGPASATCAVKPPARLDAD